MLDGTTEITIKPLSEVDEVFAWDEGEGDRTRDWRLDAHRRYFARQAIREGFELSDEALTVFERFEVVWPLDFADITIGRKPIADSTKRSEHHELTSVVRADRTAVCGGSHCSSIE
jgi:hypothetical protein